LSLPRFHAHFEASLVEPFIAIGMRLPFDAALADFSGITGMPPSVVPLQIDQIMHRAVIDVAEEGAEAAAVTSVEVKIISATGLSRLLSSTKRLALSCLRVRLSIHARK
jgi:serpin B